MGLVIQHHARLLNRWANTYVDLYFTEGGPTAAKAWALRTLQADDIAACTPLINKKFEERGYAPDNTNGDDGDSA